MDRAYYAMAQQVPDQNGRGQIIIGVVKPSVNGLIDYGWWRMRKSIYNTIAGSRIIRPLIMRIYFVDDPFKHKCFINILISRKKITNERIKVVFHKTHSTILFNLQLRKFNFPPRQTKGRCDMVIFKQYILAEFVTNY